MDSDTPRPHRKRLAFCAKALKWRSSHAQVSFVDETSWAAMDVALNEMHEAAQQKESQRFDTAFRAYRLAFARFTAGRWGRVPEHPLRPTLMPARTAFAVPWGHEPMMFVFAIAEEERERHAFRYISRAAERLRRVPEFNVYHGDDSPLTAARVGQALRRFHWG